jgi:hypothetical protein
MNSDASLKNLYNKESTHVGVGVGLAARNKGGMPFGWQLHWFDMKRNELPSHPTLLAEAFAMLKSVCFLLFATKILKDRYPDSIPKDVGLFLYLARSIIKANGWGHDFVSRQCNMTTDFLATYAWGMNKKGCLDETNPFFKDNVLPMGLKEIVINDLGMVHLLLKPDPMGGGSNAVKLLTATNRKYSVTIQYWVDGMCDYLFFFLNL